MLSVTSYPLKTIHYVLLFIQFIFLILTRGNIDLTERERETETGRETEREEHQHENINRLPPVHTLTRDQTRSLLVHVMTLQPSKPLGQGYTIVVQLQNDRDGKDEWFSGVEGIL